MLTMTKAKYLTEGEVEMLSNTLNLCAQRSDNERDTLMLDVLLRTGARANELLRIAVSDIYPETHDDAATIRIRGSKGSDERDIPISATLYNRLMTYIRSNNIAGQLFPIGYKRVQQVWYQYRPTPKKLHALRHTYAVTLYKRTKNIQLVQQMLGHRSLANTMIYATVPLDKSERLQAVI